MLLRPIVLSIALLALLALLGGAPAHAAVAPVQRQYDVTFADRGDGVVLSYHVLRSGTSRRPRPVVVLLHGGGWWRGGRSDLIDARPVAQSLARAGFIVVVPDYRLACAPAGQERRMLGYSFPGHSHLCGATIEQQVADVHDAIRHVRANAGGLGADPRRVGIFGVSAGGHLALLAATRADGTSTVRSVVNFSGPPSTGFVRLQPVRPSWGVSNIRASFTNAVGCLPSSCAEQWRVADPQALLGPATPRFATLSLAGEHESQVPVSAYRVYAVRAARYRRRHELFVVPGTCHGAGCLFRRPMGRPESSIRLVARFLQGTLR